MQLLTKRPILKKLWYGAMPVLSSAALCAVCLLLAFGVGVPQVYIGYFTHPQIFLLNWIPMLIVQLLLLCIFNRQWAAFLVSGIFFAAAHIGNFFMLKIRFEPFKFSDVRSISAGLEVAGNYDISPNSRIYLLIAAIIFGTLFLAFLVKGGLSGKKRIVTAAVCLALVWPLWGLVYSNKDIYNNKTDNSEWVIATWDKEVFLSKGFVYPFIHSIRESADLVPEGYDAEKAAELISAYTDSDIPADRRVNIMAIQLEAFSDFEAMGVEGIEPECYELFRQLKAESMSGTLVPMVLGGGTINTERSFLAGTHGLLSYGEPAPSYVRYLAEQGYTTVGSHPNRCDYYNRINVNSNLGFQDYRYTNNYYQELTGGEWYCDDVMLPEIFDQLIELSGAGETVFSFNVTLQGHSPYRSDGYDYERIFWQCEGAGEESSHVFNNYLGSLNETMHYLAIETDRLREHSEPVVMILYGDHKPYFSEAPVYEEAGISFDMQSEQGFIDYYSTPYLIWANQAAKDKLGKEFTGELPTVSPGYMMNVLFDVLGWEGNAFMKFTDGIMESLPVASYNGGYVEDGVFSTAPSEKAAGMIENYKWVQYYCQKSFE